MRSEGHRASGPGPLRRPGPGPRPVLEPAAVGVGSMLLAAVMTWPVLRDPRHTVPGLGTDPFIELWSLAWSGHALGEPWRVAAGTLFDGNAFFPAPDSLAFTDSLLGYAPLTWLLRPLGADAAVSAFSLAFVLAAAVATIGGYALARQLGAAPLGAAVAGAAIGYAPWRAGQVSHLHVLSTGGFVLALTLLARGHDLRMAPRPTGAAPRVRPGWALAGWLLAAWQLSIGFAHGLPFGYLMAVIGLLVAVGVPLRWWTSRRRPAGWWRLLAVDLVGAAVFVGVGLAMAAPYLRVRAAEPQAVAAARGLGQVARYSPDLAGLFAPPEAQGTWAWLLSGAVPVSGSNEARLLPGVVLILLALLGLRWSCWRRRWRVVLLAAAIGCGWLSLGSTPVLGIEPPFLVLWRHLPGWAADRTPGRLVAFTTLALALLAAGLLTRPAPAGQAGGTPSAAVPPSRRPRGRLPALGWVLPVLVLAEGWAVVPVTGVPQAPRAVAAAPAPMVVLPSLWTLDSRVMVWTVGRGFPALGNGQSGITPASLTRMRTELRGFPDLRSVAYLRRQGFRSVAVLRGHFGTSLWRDAGAVPDPALGLTRTDLGDSVLFVLRPVPGGGPAGAG